MVDTSKETPKVTIEKVDVPNRRAADYKTIYVNSSRVALSPWDIRIILGQAVEREGDPTHQINEDMVTVIMSPQHMKVFAAGMMRTIAAYESTFGEISDNLAVAREKAQAKPNKS